MQRNSSGKWKERLWGINLLTGEKVWECEMLHEYGWDNVIGVNDSTLIVSVGELHSVNIHDGTGWDYNVETGVKDYSGTAVTNAVGVTLLFLTGFGMITTGYDLLNSLVSNVLVDDTGYYLASKDEIAHLGMHGEVLWKTPLPKDMAGKSAVFIRDDLLYMVNYGTARVRNQSCKYGIPFLACYNKNNGEQKSFNLLGEESIGNFLVGKDHIVLLFPRRLMKFSLKDNSLVQEKEFTGEKEGVLMSSGGTRMFCEKDSVFINMAWANMVYLYVYVDSSVLMVVDKDFVVKDKLNISDLYFHYMTYNGYDFLSKDGKNDCY